MLHLQPAPGVAGVLVDAVPLPFGRWRAWALGERTRRRGVARGPAYPVGPGPGRRSPPPSKLQHRPAPQERIPPRQPPPTAPGTNGGGRVAGGSG